MKGRFVLPDKNFPNSCALMDASTADLAKRLWQELTRAPHDRHHAWRTPVLATQNLLDGPQARTVVLRRADAVLWTLGIYTDSRTPKCAELTAQPLAQLHFWSTRLNWQLRVSARASVQTHGEAVDLAWEGMRSSRASADYLSVCPPGSALSETSVPQEATTNATGHHHLALVSFEVLAMDWLALDRNGHQRARLTPDGTTHCLVP